MGSDTSATAQPSTVTLVLTHPSIMRFFCTDTLAPDDLFYSTYEPHICAR